MKKELITLWKRLKKHLVPYPYLKVAYECNPDENKKLNKVLQTSPDLNIFDEKEFQIIIELMALDFVFYFQEFLAFNRKEDKQEYQRTIINQLLEIEKFIKETDTPQEYVVFKEHQLKWITWVIDKVKPLQEPTPPPKRELTFKELFAPPYNTDEKINELKTILCVKGYTDKNNKWTGLTSNKNELATLYHVFIDKGNILKQESTRTALRLLYNEFGEFPTDNQLRGFERRPKNDTFDDFSEIITNW